MNLLQGDSAEALPKILEGIAGPCLFWLDAHYSMGKTARGPLDTPILQELHSVFSRQGSEQDVLLIDDARSYTGTGDYPDMKTLDKYIHDSRPNWIVEVKDDIIRAHSATCF